VLYGADGLAVDTADFWQEGADGVPALGVGTAEKFGAAVAVGNFNGDAFADLAIGAPGDVIGGVAGGSVIVIYGSAFRLQPVQAAAPSQVFTQNDVATSGGAENDDRFGAALAAGDFNGDLRQDLAIGVPGEDVNFLIGGCVINVGCSNRTVTVENAGLVNVIYGSQSGLSTTAVLAALTLNQATIPPGGDPMQIVESGDQFGSVLTAWNFGRSSHADLAIGVPFEDLATSGATLVDAGAVHAVYGSATGLALATGQVWTQNTAGIKDSAEPGDRFGHSVY